jgi:hypothetical protein
LCAIDAKTGEERAAVRLGVSYTASPLIADDNLYASDEDGTTAVVQTTIPPQIVARNKLSEGMRASPAVAGGATYHSLYKIAAAPAN